LCRSSGRGDLERRLRAATARILRPATVLCVVGEYKRGKSDAVNALIGQQICPVDDDLATVAVTLIGHGETPGATVRRIEDGERIIERLELDALADYASEVGNPANRRNVEMIEVAVPSPVLNTGLVVVDTPGVGAFRGGYDRAVLDFLPYADGLVFVTDASAELTPPELRFLDEAKDRCPNVIVVLTKVDLYPQWRRIAELDTHHLAQVGVADGLVAISSFLRREALQRGDAGINAESGFTDLLAAVQLRVLDHSKTRSVERSLDDLIEAAVQIRSSATVTVQALEDPSRSQQQLDELKAATEEVGHLRSAGAAWGTILGDGISDLRSAVDYRLRAGMRARVQEHDRILAEADPRGGWEEITERLQDDLIAEGEVIFSLIQEAGGEIAVRIADSIRDAVPESLLPEATAPAIREIWEASDRSLNVQGPGPFSSALSVLRGGYSGMLLLGMLTRVVGLAALGPITIGVGAAFGVKQYRDERKRQTEKRRHEARMVLRQFLDQVQIEFSNRSMRAIQDLHRALRDHFTAKIQELSAGYTAAAKELQAALQADQRKREQLGAALGERISGIDDLCRRASAARIGGGS